MTDLGPDWIVDEGGYPHREGARIVLFDSDRKVLLARGHDSHDPNHQWWFTVGGGMLPGENAKECAIRELREETGIVLATKDLVGPVLYRESEFPFANVTARQDELFYIATVDGTDISLLHSDLTPIEKMVLDEFRWFTLDELDLEAETMPVYPRELPMLVRRWSQGWDGQRTHIREWT